MSRPGLWSRLFGGDTIEVDCAIDIEQTAESFHAYAIPEGIAIRPGDVMLLHDAPTAIGFGDRFTGTGRATVIRAGWLRRQWTELAGLFALTTLYEVGFEPKEAL